ncbi:tryptophan--tRNA ligase [Candidatus Roizmanbacteria bacterium]|nr:tryptophan--tRNA ligase [Candidatus Roizmanbacteria bacterium]
MKSNLKDHIEQTLKEAGVGYRFIPLPPELPPDVPSHAAFHGIKLANAMATILYRTEKGMIAAVKRADTQIDENKLKPVAGVKQLTYATASDLNALGVESGLVPYVGLDVPYFVDKKVLEINQAYGTGGEKTVGMSMYSKDMVKVNNATVGDYTNLEKSKEMLRTEKHRLLSGITPSGDGSLHIGNYLGAVRQFIELARDHECFLMVADLHALTTVQDKATLQKNTETLILNELSLLAGGLGGIEGLEKITFFRQSDVAEHTQLQTILNNVTPLGFIKRAHAYKDKLAGAVVEDEINMGLFNYPILMAADILLYKPDLVPVGKDQKQHVEITRDIAGRFNKIFKNNVFKLPEAYIPEEVAVVLGTDGKRKMSKSLGNIISIFDDEEIIRKQVMGTFTDPMRIHASDPGHVEGNMVFTYLDFFADTAKVDELKKAYREGKVSDIEVKNYLHEMLMKFFAPARKVYKELAANPETVKKILEDGAGKARAVAGETMRDVREAVGLVNKYSIQKSANFARPPLAKPTPQGVAFKNQITIEEFSRVELRVGKVVETTNKEGSEKLIRLLVDFESEKRIIFTGVRGFGYKPEDFTGKQFFFVTNLAPRRMVGEESQGMILAVDGADKPLFLSAEGMPVGAEIR